MPCPTRVQNVVDWDAFLLIAEAVQKRLGIQTSMFEGDVPDESFYKDELLNSRVEAMLETIDARRTAA